MIKLTGTDEISNIVVVSRCNAYKNEHCKYHTAIMFTEHNLCSNFPNCYYRQLKKCEAKLEKIKEIVETALKSYYCNNCDGIGLPECLDAECHTYALDKIMTVIEGAEDD